MQLGVRLESLGQPFRVALGSASRLGVSGAQFDAIGELHPDRLGDTARREVMHLLRSHGLALTALRCPLRHGLDHPINLEPRLAHLQKAMTLSAELGARIVLVDAGRIPEKDDDPRSATLRESLTALGAHGDRIGVTLALATGVDPAERALAFLASLPVHSLAVNYDPGGYLANGFDPIAQLWACKGKLAHAHAHDARRSSASRGATSVPVGAGDVDWLACLGTMAALEYAGYLVVDTDEPDPNAVEASVRFLKRLL